MKCASMLLAMAIVLPVLAADAANPSGTVNIFTPPEDEQAAVPTYRESDGDRQRRVFLGGKGDGGLGMFNRVRNIPSLTPQQRRQIVLVFTKAKADFQPLREQLDQLRAAHQNNPARVLADPEMRDKFLDLRRQVRDLQKQLNDQVHFILTDEQERELEAMRKGELMPATFRAGVPHE